MNSWRGWGFNHFMSVEDRKELRDTVVCLSVTLLSLVSAVVLLACGWRLVRGSK